MAVSQVDRVLVVFMTSNWWCCTAVSLVVNSLTPSGAASHQVTVFDVNCFAGGGGTGVRRSPTQALAFRKQNHRTVRQRPLVMMLVVRGDIGAGVGFAQHR